METRHAISFASVTAEITIPCWHWFGLIAMNIDKVNFVIDFQR